MKMLPFQSQMFFFIIYLRKCGVSVYSANTKIPYWSMRTIILLHSHLLIENLLQQQIFYIIQIFVFHSTGANVTMLSIYCFFFFYGHNVLWYCIYPEIKEEIAY